MHRLLGYVVFDTEVENITLRNYDTNKLNFKVVCISSIDERSKQRLLYLTKDIVKVLSYTEFENFRKEHKDVLLSMLYDPATTKTEVYSTGVIKNKLCNPNNTYLQRQLSIALDYFRKDMIITKKENAG